MDIRHGDYELRPYNDSCFCVYRVMPEGYETKSPLPRADDGRYLRSMEKYPVSIADGLRIVRRLVLADGGETVGLDAAIALIERADRDFERTAR